MKSLSKNLSVQIYEQKSLKGNSISILYDSINYFTPTYNGRQTNYL
jgi:hypothetical protein